MNTPLNTALEPSAPVSSGALRPIARTLGGRTPQPNQTSMSLRVITYNVLNGGTGRESLLLEVLRVVAPDIVVLQEVFDAEFVGRLADALEMEHFFKCFVVREPPAVDPASDHYPVVASSRCEVVSLAAGTAGGAEYQLKIL